MFISCRNSTAPPCLLVYSASVCSTISCGSLCMLTELYCTHLMFTPSIRTSQETHCLSATEPIRLMLFGETVSVYCENHTEHTFTLWAERSVRTSQETHCLSDIKPNLLMLFGETVAVYCENHTEHTDTLCGQTTQSLPRRKRIASPLESRTG
jgi:hypothetical protein